MKDWINALLWAHDFLMYNLKTLLIDGKENWGLFKYVKFIKFTLYSFF
jgi:hypothetical protein